MKLVDPYFLLKNIKVFKIEVIIKPSISSSCKSYQVECRFNY